MLPVPRNTIHAGRDRSRLLSLARRGALVFEDNGAAILVETKRVYAAVRGGELGR